MSYLGEEVLKRQREMRKRMKREREKRMEEEKKKKRELDAIGVRTEELSLSQVNQIYAMKKEQFINNLMLKRKLPEQKRELLEKQSLETLYKASEIIQEQEDKKREEELKKRKKRIEKSTSSLSDLFG